MHSSGAAVVFWIKMLSPIAAVLCTYLVNYGVQAQQQPPQSETSLLTSTFPGSLSSSSVKARPDPIPNKQASSAAKLQHLPEDSARQTQAKQQPGISTSSTGGSSSSNNLCQQQEANSGSWGLTAIGAASTGLPTKTENVLICLISSGVASYAAFLKRNNWAGCVDESELDPGGCENNWNSPMDTKGYWRPRGTYAAAIIAANGGQASSGYDPRIRGVIPDGTDLYVVPVNPDTGSLGSSPSASGGSSRIRAYSVCEGRLRGLQARDFGANPPSTRWRMVILVDVEAATPATPLGSRDYKVTEQDWFATATDNTIDGFSPDVLVVAPAGSLGSGMASYPAAFPQVLAVGAYTCEGRALGSYTPGKPGQPILLAPGQNIPVPDVRKDGISGVKLWEGSAAAAAYVAGSAARLWSKFPACSADGIKQALLSSRPAGGSGPALLNLDLAQTHLAAANC